MRPPTTTRALHADADRYESFCHEAFVYSGEREFVNGASAFIRDGLEAQEPTLVVVSSAKIDLLREELNGAGADTVRFADMDEVGANPARIIPAWRDFVDEHSAPGRALRGIGEPVFPERSQAELVECHRHEALLNLAFHESPGLWLLCPYDAGALGPEVIEAATRTHPLIVQGSTRHRSSAYAGLEATAAPFAEPLPEPAAVASEVAFDGRNLSVLRGCVGEHAARAGIGSERAGDLVLAVNEVATNSVRHASGAGAVRVWSEPDAVICEVRDDGLLDEPLAGRVRPGPEQIGGYGLWLANQLCELVQLRSSRSGTVVRLHMRRS